MKLNGKTIYINISVILFTFIIIVMLSKVVRYTIMKETLVDTSIGHHMLGTILYNMEDAEIALSSGDESVATKNACLLFKKINIFNLTTYTQFEVYITILWNVIVIIILLRLEPKLDLKQAIFIILTIAVLNIFDFNLAKEPVQMLYFVLIYMILISNKLNDKAKNILSILVILVSALTYRNYYVIIAFFAICAQLLSTFGIIKKEKVTLKNILTLILLIGIIYFTFLNIAKIIMPKSYNELIRVRTRVSTASSDMRNLLPGASTNTIVFVMDYLIMIIRMLFPIELVKLGAKGIPYIIYQIMITFFVINALKNIKHNDKQKNLALFIFLGFLFGSATFEPDFGSWVRHEAVIFPIMFIIAEIKTKKKSFKRNEKNEKNDIKNNKDLYKNINAIY